MYKNIYKLYSIQWNLDTGIEGSHTRIFIYLSVANFRELNTATIIKVKNLLTHLASQMMNGCKCLAERFEKL